jgi:hypothetical protein
MLNIPRVILRSTLINVGNMTNAYNILVGNLKGTDHWEEKVWTGFIWLRIGISGGLS